MTFSTFLCWIWFDLIRSIWMFVYTSKIIKNDIYKSNILWVTQFPSRLKCQYLWWWCWSPAVRQWWFVWLRCPLLFICCIVIGDISHMGGGWMTERGKNVPPSNSIKIKQTNSFFKLKTKIVKEFQFYINKQKWATI